MVSSLSSFTGLRRDFLCLEMAAHKRHSIPPLSNKCMNTDLLHIVQKYSKDRNHCFSSHFIYQLNWSKVTVNKLSVLYFWSNKCSLGEHKSYFQNHKTLQTPNSSVYMISLMKYWIWTISPAPWQIIPVQSGCLKDLLDATVLQIISAGEMEETVQGELMKNKLKEIKEQAITNQLQHLRVLSKLSLLEVCKYELSNQSL